MAFQVEQLASATHGGVLTADRRLFLDVTEQLLVEADDPRARFQLAAPGHAIPTAAVKRLRLSLDGNRVVQLDPACAADSDDEQPEPIDPSRTDDDLLEQFTIEAKAAGYRGRAPASIAQKRLANLRAGGNGHGTELPEKKEKEPVADPEKRESEGTEKKEVSPPPAAQS